VKDKCHHTIYCIIKKILRKIYGKQSASVIRFLNVHESCEVKIIFKGFWFVVKWERMVNDANYPCYKGQKLESISSVSESFGS